MNVNAISNILTERVRINYEENSETLQNINYRKNTFMSEYLQLTRTPLDGTPIQVEIHDNMTLNANSIVGSFLDKRVLFTLVIAKTQSGKTGTMCVFIKKYLEDTKPIDIENIYIITGLSSIEWKNQTKNRMPECIGKRVFHRGDLLKNFVDTLRGKKNVIIIMDEIQVAGKVDQTIHRAFEKSGLLNKQVLYENDIKIVEFTATPNGAVKEFEEWGDARRVIIGETGHRYVGANDLLQSGRIKQYRDLFNTIETDDRCESSEKSLGYMRELKKDIDLFERPCYHIIRVVGNVKKNNAFMNGFKYVFPSDLYSHVNFNQSTTNGDVEAIFPEGICRTQTSERDEKFKDINDILCQSPTQHTIIFVKEMLRCAKSVVQQYLGVWYERYTSSPDDSVLIQGIRITGYPKVGDNLSICYTNKNTIINYHLMCQRNFVTENFQGVNWNSATFKISNNTCVNSKTFNNHENYDTTYTNIESINRESIKDNDIEEREFNNFNEVNQFFKEQHDILMKTIEIMDEDKKNSAFFGKGPRNRKCNSIGIYEATIRGKTRKYTVDEVKMERKSGLSSTKLGYRLYTCYTDEDVLKWVFIYQK
jgi:hypothetical protein